MAVEVKQSDATPYTVEAIIGRQIVPAPGRTAAAKALFRELENRTTTLREESETRTIDLVRGTLLLPSVRKLLGLCDAVLMRDIPRWNMFPLLRLAHIVRVGQVCQQMRIAAAKIAFGSERLAGAVFGAAASREWTDQVASYVLAGRIDADLGAVIDENPRALVRILKFRESQEGMNFRKEVMLALNVGTANEFCAAIDGGLRRSIGLKAMQKARDALSGVLTAVKGQLSVTPALWTNLKYSDTALNLWKRRSAEVLEEHCRKLNISAYDLCPCGSGEKLRFCCEGALRG